MAAIKYPRTIKSGRLAGQTFNSQAEYDAARKVAQGSPDIEPTRLTSVPKRQTLKYSKSMVEAVVKMFSGVLGMVPLFRGEAAITEQEQKWLIDDWYDFGKGHPFFANLVVRMFSVDTYGKLALDHVLILGSRLALAGRLPATVVMPLQLAYMTRQAMDGTVDFGLEAEPGTPDLGVEARGTPSPDWGNGNGENVPSPETVDAPAA